MSTKQFLDPRVRIARRVRKQHIRALERAAKIATDPHHVLELQAEAAQLNSIRKCPRLTGEEKAALFRAPE